MTWLLSTCRQPAYHEVVPMIPSRTTRRWSGLAGLVLAAALGTGTAAGQGKFHITHTRDLGETDPDHIVLRGTVTNEDRRDVVNVYLTAEALDAASRVVASGVTYVGPAIQRSASVAFVIKVPRVQGIKSFRVAVTSFRYGLTAIR